MSEKKLKPGDTLYGVAYNGSIVYTHPEEKFARMGGRCYLMLGNRYTVVKMKIESVGEEETA